MRLRLAIAAVLAAAQASFAQVTVRTAPAPQAAPEGAPTGSITVQPGFAASVSIGEAFSTIVVGDPDLVDAIAQSDNRFVIRAKKDGTGVTNVIAWGATGRIVSNLTVIVSAGAGGGMRVFHGTNKATSRTVALGEHREYRCGTGECVLVNAPTVPPGATIVTTTRTPPAE